MRSKKPDPLTSLGGRIRLLREAFGDAQLDLAEAVEVSRAAVSQWEHDETNPQNDKVERIAARYRVPVEWLMFGRGPQPILPHPPHRRAWRRRDGANSDLLSLARANIVAELVATEPTNLGGGREWVVPPHALISRPDETVVFRVPMDSKPLRQGDYVFVDRTRRDLQAQGFWLVDTPTTGPIVVRARLGEDSGGKPTLELVHDDVALNRKNVKNIIGRIVARFTALA